MTTTTLVSQQHTENALKNKEGLPAISSSGSPPLLDFLTNSMMTLDFLEENQTTSESSTPPPPSLSRKALLSTTSSSLPWKEKSHTTNTFRAPPGLPLHRSSSSSSSHSNETKWNNNDDDLYKSNFDAPPLRSSRWSSFDICENQPSHYETRRHYSFDGVAGNLSNKSVSEQGKNFTFPSFGNGVVERSCHFDRSEGSASDYPLWSADHSSSGCSTDVTNSIHGASSSSSSSTIGFHKEDLEGNLPHYHHEDDTSSGTASSSLFHQYEDLMAYEDPAACTTASNQDSSALEEEFRLPRSYALPEPEKPSSMLPMYTNSGLHKHKKSSPYYGGGGSYYSPYESNNSRYFTSPVSTKSSSYSSPIGQRGSPYPTSSSSTFRPPTSSPHPPGYYSSIGPHGKNLSRTDDSFESSYDKQDNGVLHFGDLPASLNGVGYNGNNNASPSPKSTVVSSEARAMALQLLSKNAAWFYEVEFKRYRREIYAGSPNFKKGTYVKVEADRGMDLGHIVRVSQDLEALQLEIKTSGDAADLMVEKRSSDRLKFILNPASDDELNTLRHKFEEERAVLSHCREKVRQRCLPMNVIDAEFQFDRHKLTFYFSANNRIDFRELVRDLFSVYKTRIWLQQLTEEQHLSYHRHH